MGTLRARIEKRLALAAMSLPRTWMVALAGGRRRQVDEFVLDEQVQLAIAMHKRLGKKQSHELAIEDARKELEASAAIMAPKPRTMARVEDRRINGIPVRIYEPLMHKTPAPALVFFHGGGFCLGSLDSHDAPCRVLADVAHCIVIAVDYRLAPEHKFPAAVDDSVAAFRWVVANADKLGIDPARVAVGGDSAGGNLAAVVCQQTKNDARKPAFQLLIYPATDFTMSSPSHSQMGRGFFLEHDTMVWFRDRYLNNEGERHDVRASPLFASLEDLAGQPPAMVATAGFDPLRDEGRAYADKLRDAGVPVRYRCYPSLFHGFFSASGGVEAARSTLVEAAAALREALA
jgi:acetyl esterase